MEKTCRFCGYVGTESTFRPLTSMCNQCRYAYHRKWMQGAGGKALTQKINQSPRAKFTRCKHQAGKRGLVFSLTRQEFDSLIVKPCHYCGSPLGLTGAGIDRYDNTKGYTLDNVVPCCGECNRMKHEYFTGQEMELIGTAIALVKQARLKVA